MRHTSEVNATVSSKTRLAREHDYSGKKSILIYSSIHTRCCVCLSGGEKGMMAEHTYVSWMPLFDQPSRQIYQSTAATTTTTNKVNRTNMIQITAREQSSDEQTGKQYPLRSGSISDL